MWKRRNIIAITLAISGPTLLCAGYCGYAYYQFDRFLWKAEATSYATYAGTMQCVVDVDHGIRHYYRLTAATADQPGHVRPTGDRDAGVDVWSWPYYPSVGEPATASDRAFVEAYNRRMRTAVTASATRP